MTAHTHTRLEKSGTVVAYLAPQVQVQPVFSNDLRIAARARTRQTIARDLQLIVNELDVHGHFLHSDDLPQPHQDDLNTLFGGLPVTPEQQVNRIAKFLLVDGGPFEFYRGTDSYTATTDGAVDVENGTYPVLQVAEFRPEPLAGLDRATFFLKLVAGLER